GRGEQHDQAQWLNKWKPNSTSMGIAFLGNHLTAFAKMDDSGFTDSFKQIPDPPPEPPELWLRLATQAKEAGNKGIAACLLLYTLACARALREFRVGKHTNGDEPNFTQREG
ncbi:hypothetical protein, partial [Nitrosomonas communis]